MRVLLVGAGAVGQVYGHHLQAGGAEVAFLVRPKYADEARAGFALYPLNRRRPREQPIRFRDFGVLTDASQVEGGAFDQIWLTVSSAGLRGPWLDELCGRAGKATVVALQPGLDDRDYLLERIPAERLVQGMISLVSYHAPLEGETVPEPGMAYWLPPFMPSPFSGPPERARQVAAALRAGRLPAVVHKNVALEVAYPGALLTALVASLEGCGWSLRALDPTKQWKVGWQALREMAAVIRVRLGAGAPLWMHLLGRRRLRLFLRLAARMAPFPMETYVRVHFSKVREQTRLSLQTFLAQGAAANLPTTALSQLLAFLPPAEGGLSQVPGNG
jgi:2-dehydropantoate 2-reductase